MIELLESHGIEVRSLAKYERGELVPSSVLQAAERKTTQTERFWMTPQVGVPYQARRLKRCVRDLKTLSESVLPSRAIRFVRNGIAGLEYGVQPKKVIRKDREAKKALAPLIDEVLRVIDNPNITDDDFPSFVGQIVEDILCFDAGCWEYVEKPKYVIGNPYLALEVVPGYSMAQKVAWSGDPKEPRWVQVTEDGQIAKEKIRDKEIEYLLMRKRSWTPFGLSPLETVIDIMDAWLNLASYQRTTASDLYPPTLLSLGDQQLGMDQMDIIRSWWNNEIRGQGKPAYFAGFKDAQVLDLKPGGDERLYLAYMEMLTRTVAYSFGLKPLDVGIERDVNRSTAEVQRVQSLAEGIKSIAQFIASKINQRVIPRIATILNNPEILKLEFFWMNLNPADDAVQATMYDTYIKDGTMFQDEVRAELDLEPRPDGLGMMDYNQQQQLYSLDPTGNAGKGTVPEPDDTQTQLAIQDLKKTTAQAVSLVLESVKETRKEVAEIRAEVKSSHEKTLETVRAMPAPEFTLHNPVTVNNPEQPITLNPSPINIEGTKVDVHNEQPKALQAEKAVKVGMRVERNALGHLTAKIEYDQETGKELKRWKVSCDAEGRILEVSEA